MAKKAGRSGAASARATRAATARAKGAAAAAGAAGAAIGAAARPMLSDERLFELQRNTFRYFWEQTNPANGLLPDNTPGEDVPASIAGVGLALAVYTVAAEREYVSREHAAGRALATLRFFAQSEQSEAPDATGYRGFYYHFLDVQTGKRAMASELSTIDTTILMAGALTAAAYFDRDTDDEREISSLADELYRRVEWDWARAGDSLVKHGWKPKSGFLKHRWNGYNEGLILYILGLGSPTHPLPDVVYPAWSASYRWEKIYGQELLFAGPLFIHQLSHIWIDFRGIQDEYMRDRGIDYFENSRRATYVQRAYAIHNPRRFLGYSDCSWGISASNGPGPATRRVKGITRRFYGYQARGAPYGPDDGTMAPWAAVASLPFAPEIVLPALHHFHEQYTGMVSEYGLSCSFNPTFPDPDGKGTGWISGGHFALDQGPVILMIENYRSGLLWRLMRRCPYVVEGLQRAGFKGGWLRNHNPGPNRGR